MVVCPIKSCGLEFLNKNSLTNHFSRNSDPEHSLYYKNSIVNKICPSCNKKVDNRCKIYEGVCYTCFKKSQPDLKIRKEFKKRICFKCGHEVEGLFSKNNTRILCPECEKIKNYRKREYKKAFDEKRYKEAKSLRLEQKAQKDKDKNAALYKILKEDLIKEDLPIYKICKKHHISLLSIRKILPFFMSDLDYQKRNHIIRSRAIQARIEGIKNYFKNRAKPRTARLESSSLEIKIGDQILLNYPEAKIRYNIWKSLKDDLNQCYVHLESDVIINFDALRIIILCDGEAFHGKACYFCGDTIELDEWKSRLLHKFNPFIFRYSETEIKKNIAIEHFIATLQDIRNKKIIRYYRNWMLGIEEKLFREG